jgi:hypothetical protein
VRGGGGGRGREMNGPARTPIRSYAAHATDVNVSTCTRAGGSAATIHVPVQHRGPG